MFGMSSAGCDAMLSFAKRLIATDLRAALYIFSGLRFLRTMINHHPDDNVVVAIFPPFSPLLFITTHHKAEVELWPRPGELSFASAAARWNHVLKCTRHCKTTMSNKIRDGLHPLLATTYPLSRTSLASSATRTWSTGSPLSFSTNCRISGRSTSQSS